MSALQEGPGSSVENPLVSSAVTYTVQTLNKCLLLSCFLSGSCKQQLGDLPGWCVLLGCSQEREIKNMEGSFLGKALGSQAQVSLNESPRCPSPDTQNQPSLAVLPFARKSP